MCITVFVKRIEPSITGVSCFRRVIIIIIIIKIHLSCNNYMIQNFESTGEQTFYHVYMFIAIKQSLNK